MKTDLFHIVLWVVAGILALLFVVNASYMLASPRAWFRLPSWIKAQGTLTEKRYSTGWGAIQVRLTGAIMLSVIGWVIYDITVRR
jgi:hypothetical protein